MMDHRLYKVPNAELLFATLRDYQLRTEHEYVGYASANLAYRASHVNRLSIPYFHIPSMNNQILAASSGDDALQPAQLEPVAAALLEHFYTESDIITYRKFSVYVKKRKLSDNIGINGAAITVKDLIRDIFYRSQKVNYWLLARFCFSQLSYTLTDLADSLTLLAARNLTITVGDNNHTEIKVDQSFSNATYFESVRQLFPDLLERTLVQELISAIGSLIRSEPKLFDGLHSVQLRNFMLLCGMDKGDAEDVSMLEWLGLQSPAKLYKKIRSILTSRKKVFSQGINHITPYKIHHNENTDDENPVLSDAMDTDWLEWRTARGLITHFDANFLKDIWHSLMFSQSLIFSNANGASFSLDCKTTRQSMTPGEESFAHLIDQLTHQLYPAYYKSSVVEALYAYTQFCINNPQVRFQNPVVFREVLERAAVRYMSERKAQMNSLGIETDLTVFMQQSPHIMNLYVTLIYAEITQPY